MQIIRWLFSKIATEVWAGSCSAPLPSGANPPAAMTAMEEFKLFAREPWLWVFAGLFLFGVALAVKLLKKILSRMRKR